jgi:hypothetical protein
MPDILDRPDLDRVDRLGTLTREYARFSRNAAGLGHVLGGAICLAAYLANGLVDWPHADGAARLLLALAPVVWIAAKELLRARVYQRYGRVLEPMPAGERRWFLARTAIVVAIVAFVLASTLPAFVRAPTLAGAGYLFFVCALPVVAWRLLPTTEEFVIGVFLICQAAVVLGGGSYSLGSQLAAPVVSLIALVTGTVQHRRFRALEREMLALRPAA